MSVFVLACKLSNNCLSNCCCELPLAQIAELIGYEPLQVFTAIRALQEKGFIKKLGDQGRNKGKFDQVIYELCGADREGLAALGTNRRRFVGLRTALHRRENSYFSLPVCIMDFLPRLRGPALAVYVAAVRLCNLAGKREVRVSVAELRTLAGVARNETLRCAVDVLAPYDGMNRHILETIFSGHTVRLTLLNPATGLPLEYSEIIEAETGTATRRDYSDDLLLNWACSAIWNAAPDVLKPGSNGDMLGHCPMCAGVNAKRKGTRTLAINVEKRSSHNSYGIYFCHSCKAGVGETLLDLVMRCTGLTAMKAMASLERLKRESGSQQ